MLVMMFAVRLATLGHDYLARYAPSNAIVARVRGALPRWRVVGGLWVLAWLLAAIAHLLLLAIAAGAPQWLYLVALVAAWDAIKFGLLGWLVVLRWLAAAARRVWARRGRASSRGVPSVTFQPR